MKKRKKQQKIVILISVITLACLIGIIGTSVALWQNTFTQSGTNLSTYDCFEITLDDSDSNIINVSNSYPLSDTVGFKSSTIYTATISNVCQTPAIYNVMLNEISSSTLSDAYIKIGYENEAILFSELDDVENQELTTDEYKIRKVLTSGVLEGQASTTISLQAWIDENATTDIQGLTFAFNLGIYAVAGTSNDYLGQKVLANQIMSNDVDYTTAEPQALSYKKKVNENQIYTDQLASSISGNKLIGTGYTFDEDTGYYKLKNTKALQTYDNNSIGYYTCNTTSNTCQNMYYIKAVNINSSNAAYAQQTTQETQNLTNTDVVVGKAYSFNSATGTYDLADTLTISAYSQDYVGYYTCASSSSSCSTMYEILSVEQSVVSSYVKYYSTPNYNYITSADLYTSKVSSKSQNSGLYQAQDNDGTTYYFRGDISNNYVSFAGYTWRVVRINGDGTIRLILDENIGSISSADLQSLGYTYNNISFCTVDNPCNTDSGISSDIKTFLEEWYDNNLTAYDDYIATSSYCSNSFGSTPNLKCPNITNNYGGYYKLKIGLISADEANMAGLANTYTDNVTTSNYLYTKNNLWTSSYIDNSIVVAKNGYLTTSSTDTEGKIRPVINLKADIKVSGNGTQDDPYVVDTSSTLAQVIKTNSSSLKTVEENQQTTYYFQASAQDNYVSFAGYTWRIVKINSDNSVKLILSNDIGSLATNSATYTYDSTMDEDNYFIRGTNSTIKTALENWYKENIINNNLDGYVTYQTYCDNASPITGSLVCSGYKYKLKIGLINAEELNLIGVNNSYLAYNTNYWTMSSYDTMLYYANSSLIDLANINQSNALRPVINIAATTQVLLGDGTQDNPYEFN